jgi:hypothetical protein
MLPFEMAVHPLTVGTIHLYELVKCTCNMHVSRKHNYKIYLYSKVMWVPCLKFHNK